MATEAVQKVCFLCKVAHEQPPRKVVAVPRDDLLRAWELLEHVRLSPNIDTLSVRTPHTLSTYNHPPETWTIFYTTYYQSDEGDDWDEHYCSGPTLLEAAESIHRTFCELCPR